MKECVFLAYSVGDSAVSNFFSELAQQLGKEHKVIIFSDKRNPLSFAMENVEVLHWPSVRPTKWKDFIFLKQQIKKHRPKLMLSTFGANNMFLLAGFFKGVPHRIATHRTISSHFQSSGFKLFRKRWVFKLATQLMANSEATKEDLTTTFGVPTHKIFVTYNAVVNPEIQNEKNPNQIVYAGRLSVNKGTPVLLEAFAKLKQKAPDMHLKMLGGTSSEVKKYMQMAGELGLKDEVTFLGSRPRAEVLTEFSKARYAVVPSISEGFGFVVIEAFSVRTPVIGSKTGGIKEIIRDGKDGLLVNPGDPEDLVKAMRSLNEDFDRVLELGQNAHQRFLNTFELRTVVNQLSTYLANKISS